MATYFRVHPDTNNRDPYDEDGKFYDDSFEEIDYDDITELSPVFLTVTPGQFEDILAARK